MPEPVQRGQRYLPGLDGLRALAVLAVVAYHLNVGWARSGMLGVGVFFTLSGYLITDLLLGQREATGALHLADFWLRRARRLLPALFVMLTVVVAWVTLLDRPQLPGLRGAVTASVAYVSNWWLIAQHSSYFARFGPAPPLGHLWSLAVEEQFYLVWPGLLWLGLRWMRGRSGARTRLAAAAVLLATFSAVEMALLYQPGYDPTRVYDGTDTRAFALLIGATLAFVWPSRRLSGDVAKGARWILDGTGAAGLAVIALMIVCTNEYSAFLYRGGMVLLSVCAALVVGVAASPASRIGKLLGCRPLRWLGVRSYGIYLWHYPIIVLTTPANGRDTLARGTLQVAASIGAAAVSWRYVEEPVRRGAIGRWWARATAAGWNVRKAGRRALTAAGGALVTCALAGAGLTGVVQPGSAGRAATTPLPSATTPLPSATSAASAQPRREAASRPSRSSCRTVVHIGDSTSDGLISRNYLPDPGQRLAAQYARVGATKLVPKISGGRSVVETVDGQADAYTVARRLARGGYRGCWVLALGTNDAADVYVGSRVSAAARIQRMMSVIGRQRVMWVNVRSLLARGPYAESEMLLWDSALVRACARYPDMRVYDWAAATNSSWFISDGIHYTSAGYEARAHLIASALAAAFPAGRRPVTNPRNSRLGAHRPSCLVG
jgi:peptidoglycan/LPS O-acetylase OafA/YrhL/lysophospholipase L1-like esterase